MFKPLEIYLCYFDNTNLRKISLNVIVLKTSQCNGNYVEIERCYFGLEESPALQGIVTPHTNNGGSCKFIELSTDVIALFSYRLRKVFKLQRIE